LQRCAEIYNEVNAFLSPENFAGLARWADQNGVIRRKLVARSNSLFFSDDLDQGMTLLPVSDLDETLVALRSAKISAESLASYWWQCGLRSP